MDNSFLKFNIKFFFASKYKIYLYIILSILLLSIYGVYMIAFHSSYENIPRPFHVFTYNIDRYYQLVYWVLLPFIFITVLTSNLHKVSDQIKIRINSYRKILYFYLIQLGVIGLWGTILIAIITFSCFLIDSKAILPNDYWNIFFLLFFCFLNFIIIGLALILLAEKFSEQISFITFFLISQCDHYLFNHLIFQSTKLLYRPNSSIMEIVLSLLENISLLAALLALVLVQLQKKGD